MLGAELRFSGKGGSWAIKAWVAAQISATAWSKAT
jgi:hypothetical protein